MSRQLPACATTDSEVLTAPPPRPTGFRRLGRIVVVTLLTGVAACGNGGPTATSEEASEAPALEAEAAAPAVGPVRPPSYVGPLMPSPESAALGLPEPERPAVGEGQFMGAMKLERTSNATDDDRLVVHRLNSGFWVANTNEQFVNIDPMLDYGPVFDQTTDPPGAVGGTTLLAMHNITRPPPEVTGVTIDGVTYSHSRMMVSRFNEQQLAVEYGARRFQNNVNPGDRFEVILNNPNRTTTVLAYEVNDVKNVSPDGPDFQALKDPPADPTQSRLVVYSCWEPGDDKLRQAAFAVLKSRVTQIGEVANPGPQPARPTVIR